MTIRLKSEPRRKASGRLPSAAKHAGIGFLSGLTVAAAGAIKDAPYEGFKPLTFIRSPVIGAVEAPVLGKVFRDPHPVLLFLSTIATERLTVEAYKLARAKMSGKFVYGEWNMPRGRLMMTPPADHGVF